MIDTVMEWLLYLLIAAIPICVFMDWSQHKNLDRYLNENNCHLVSTVNSIEQTSCGKGCTRPSRIYTYSCLHGAYSYSE